jgi:orotate phosphoribosyltransferase
MDEKRVMQILSEVNAVISNSHVVYTSGKHGNAYVNKDALYVHPEHTAELCQMMADQYDANKIDVVAGPTVGGVILSQWVAYHLNKKRSGGETLSIYAEEEVSGEEKKRIFKRGYDKNIPNKNVLVVEDVVTTGGSARKVIEAVRALGGNVVGLSVLCNRGGIKPEDVGGVPINALTNVKLDAFEADGCPLCAKNIPINTAVGKGKEFLAKKGLPVGK